MKIRVIDLLVKTANKEEVPNKIKWKNKIYIKRSDVEWYILDNGHFDDLLPIRVIFLNDEIEIIEEPKKIEKLNYQDEAYVDSAIEGIFFRKMNEIIDYINNKEENNE